LGALPVQGLDKDPHAFPETQRQVESALLLDVVISKGAASSSCLPADGSLHLVDDDFVVFKWDNLAVKGGLIRTLVNHHVLFASSVIHMRICHEFSDAIYIFLICNCCQHGNWCTLRAGRSLFLNVVMDGSYQ
jgi:hypothetical protein